MDVPPIRSRMQRFPLTPTLSLCMDRGDGRHLFGDMVDGFILAIGLM